MDFITKYVLGNQDLLATILQTGITITVAPMVILALLRLANSPPVRAVVGPAVYGFGYTLSVLGLKWLGKYAEKTESEVQSFVTFLVKNLFSGMDKDDTLAGAETRTLG